jgi:CHAD domain-containing protein
MAKHKRLVWSVSPGPARNASLKLPGLSQAYFQAGRALLNGDSTLKSLHGFRLETKRFRYTLELFRPCYGAGLDQRLALLRQVQDLLGEINDCASTLILVGKNEKKISAFLERRMARKKSELRRYWRQTFDRAGQERWWADYLARFAKDPSQR